MLSMNELHGGTLINMHGEPYEVVSKEFIKNAQRRPVTATKLRSLISGKVLEVTFQQSDRLEEADVARKKALYLYHETDSYFFMDNESFEQFALPQSIVGDKSQYLIENATVEVLTYNDKPINVNLPIKMAFTVTEAAPGVKGNSAQNAMKEATLETGMRVQVPLFITEGEKVLIDTRNGKYVERA